MDPLGGAHWAEGGSGKQCNALGHWHPPTRAGVPFATAAETYVSCPIKYWSCKSRAYAGCLRKEGHTPAHDRQTK